MSAPQQQLQEIESRNKRWQQQQDQRPGARCDSSKYTSNKTHYSPVDADARIAVKPGKPRQLCYLQQLAVDSAHHVITYTQANHADKKDSQCLLQVVEGLLGKLQNQHLDCYSIAADAGYSSGENYHWLGEQQLEGYIPLHGQFQGGPDGFSYHREGNYWLCPYGKQVSFKKIVYDRYGNPQVQYMAKRADCKDCPIKAACMGKSKEKRIQLTYYWQEYEQVKERVQSRKGRRMKRIRQSRVEPVFGTLIVSVQ